MKTFKSSQQVLVRIFLVLLLALLAFQSLGLNGLAAPAARPRYFQNEGGLTALSCSAPIYRNAQVVLMIDDSGSMIATNDRGFQRNLGATGVVDVLSNKLSTLQSGQQSPDVKIAVLHFSNYIKAGGTIRQLNQDRDNVNSDIDQNKKFPYRLEKTNFVQLFEYAARLWKPGAKPAPMLTADDNAIRLIFLFTDGTPDYGEGPLKGNTLKTNIGEIATQVLKLPPVNTIYYVAYKGSYSHLDDIKTYWDNQKNLHPELPNIEIYTGDSFKNQLEKEVTTAWVEQKIAVKLDNQPIQAEIGKPANIIFQLVDDSSSDNRVISNDVLPPGFKLNGVSVTSGSQVIPVTRDDPNYQFSWTPKTLNDDSVNITASFVNDRGNKFDCAGTLKLQFPDISTTTFTPTPTGTATSTPGTPITDTPTPTGTIVTKTFTPTPTSTATVTETFTPTPVTITPPLPAPLALSLIVMPPRYCSGDSPTQSIVLPMKLHSEAPNLTIGSQTSDLTWSITAQGMADGNPIGKSYIPEVKPADAKNGEYNLIIAPIPNADEIQVEVGAAVKVGDQSINIPKATGIITAPPSVPCNLPVCAYSGAWKIWFWPLLIGLAGLMIILLVLRFGSRRDEAESQESNRDIFRNRDWHFLFWPLLVLLIMLVLVRVIDDWICVVPPWLFLVSILVWLVFALLIRFFAGRDSSQPRPWWLLLLLLALAFLGYLAMTIPVLSLLWLLLVLLMAWVILWYLGPDDHITPAGEPTHPPHPPAPVDGFDIQVGPSGDPLEDGSIKVPVQLSFRSSDTAMIAPEWHVHSWNVDVSSPDRELAWTVEPKAQEPDGTEPGSCLVTIHGVGLDRTLIEVTAGAELDINHHLVETLKATSTILIVPVNNKTLPEEATRDIIREVPVPVIHEVIKEVEVTREVPIPIITETIKEVVITNQIIVYVPDPTHPDDLTELEGIGTVTAQLLNQKGIFSFQQLAQIDIGILNLWLGEANLKMMDPKTWPQQARLADIAKRYGKEEDRQNYLAYQAWLRDGIEPDEYDKEEKDRRKDALVWNRISECAPLVLSLALGSASAYWEEALRLPLRLNYEADQSWLATVEWKVSAKAMPAGEEVSTIVESVDGAPGQFMLAIGPVQDTNAEEIQVVIQALLNGRSIEIYYGSAVMVQVTAPSAADPLEELEGIGEAVRKLLNANGIHTFEQLAGTDVETLNRWLNEKGYQRMDPKTWPQQAKLADIARKYGRQEDRQSYEAYKAWLVGGIEPDEVDKDEKDRRPVARPWPIAADSMPDPLEDLEGIGKDVAQILNDKGIFTFRQLAKTDVGEMIRWLNECGYERMDPKTWPQQAKLAGIAKEFDTEEDRRSYEAYKAWLKGGIEPDEYHKEEKDRRTVALTWHGTAELTQRAYPEIFG